MLHYGASTSFGTELLCLITMAYYVACCIFSMFRIKVLNLFELFPGSTDGYTLTARPSSPHLPLHRHCAHAPVRAFVWMLKLAGSPLLSAQVVTLLLMRIVPPLTWNYYNLVFEAAQIQNQQMDAWNITVMVDKDHRGVIPKFAEVCRGSHLHAHIDRDLWGFMVSLWRRSCPILTWYHCSAHTSTSTFR